MWVDYIDYVRHLTVIGVVFAVLWSVDFDDPQSPYEIGLGVFLIVGIYMFLETL